MLTSAKRNRILAESTAPRKYESNEAVVAQRAGVGTVYLNGAPILSDTVANPPLPTVPQFKTLPDIVFAGLNGVLKYSASSNVGPTVTSRLLYLYFTSLAQAWSWISPSVRLVNGVKDNWDWSPNFPITDPSQQITWMTHILAYILPPLLNNDTVIASSLLANELNLNSWTSDQQTEAWAQLQATGNYTAWQTAWESWYDGRNADGYLISKATQIATAENTLLPNRGTTFPVVADTESPAEVSTFPSPYKWTPLSFNGATKNYYTYNWGDVASTCLTPADESTLIYVANIHYLPGLTETPVYRSDIGDITRESLLGMRPELNQCTMITGTTPGATARQAEIIELVNRTSRLSDIEKTYAEFWAGGPNTCSPPGMLAWFWMSYMKHFMKSKNISLNTLFYSALDLGINLFEAGRLAWNIKRRYMQARPIQEVRRMFYNCPITSWNGNVHGRSWVPYQEANFVTPPFADFVSGHTTFSQAFANVMTHWFGASIPQTSTPITESDLTIVSHILPSSQTGYFAQFVVPSGSSRIQPGIVPAQDMNLRWTTWQSIATTAGLSRQYGGIHAMSAHLGGQALAIVLTPILRTYWFST